jgi:hypothetical protein
VSLNAFFLYFGGKSTLARHYPAPRFETIIEPFAGAAGYSTRYHFKRVVLVEKDPRIAAVWRYLLSASARELLGLPLLEPGQNVNELVVPCEAARDLIGKWLGFGDGRPRPTITGWAARPGRQESVWSRRVRARLASQVEKIRHWQIIEGSYELAPDIAATWFIDPPYQVAGTRYPCGTAAIDFAELGAWCRTRRGQVMVCENAGATWLPFQPFRSLTALNHEQTVEAIWTNESDAA